MKKYLFSIVFLTAAITHASEEQQVVVALPLYGAFAEKPNSTDTRTQILGDLRSFLPVMGSIWNISKLTYNQTKIADLGIEIEKTQTGSFNILKHLAAQTKTKSYGTMSQAMQDSLACSIASQPLIPGIQTLLSVLQTQNIGILGYANQDEKEYECFKKYCASKDIDLPTVCDKGIVVYRHYETVPEFSDEQPFLQKNGVTVSYKPFPNLAFLHALQHHAPDTHVLVAVPFHLRQSLERVLAPGLDMVPFTTVTQFTKLLQDRNILQEASVLDIL